MKSSLILLSFLFGSLFGYSQTSSGNRFWVAYMENLPLFANDDPVFIISVDASVETSVTISRPANGWSQTYTAAANTLTNITLPSEIFYTIGEQVVDDFGILIETDNLVATLHVLLNNTKGILGVSSSVSIKEASIISILSFNTLLSLSNKTTFEPVRLNL